MNNLLEPYKKVLLWIHLPAMEIETETETEMGAETEMEVGMIMGMGMGMETQMYINLSQLTTQWVTGIWFFWWTTVLQFNIAFLLLNLSNKMNKEPLFLFGRICAGCQAEIGYGRYLNCLNAYWHPECFRCRACDLPISDYEVVSKPSSRWIKTNCLTSGVLIYSVWD